MKTMKGILTTLALVLAFLLNVLADSNADCAGEVKKLMRIVNQIDGEAEYVAETSEEHREYLKYSESLAESVYKQMRINIKDGVLDEEEKDYLRKVSIKIGKNRTYAKGRPALKKLNALHGKFDAQSDRVARACRD